MSVRGTMHVVVQRYRATTGSVANSWNRTLAAVSFRDFKMLSERKETGDAKYQTDRFTEQGEWNNSND